MTDFPNIVKAEISGEEVNVVDARELHANLRVKTKFADWINRRIKQGGFEENQDFTSFLILEKREVGGSEAKEYTLSLDMAKHLAMMERNSQGKKVRQYFIDTEKKLRSNQSAIPPELLARLDRFEKALENNCLMTAKAIRFRAGLKNKVSISAVKGKLKGFYVREDMTPDGKRDMYKESGIAHVMECWRNGSLKPRKSKAADGQKVLEFVKK